MVNKILGSIAILLALFGIFISIRLFKNAPDLGGILLAGSLFAILIGIVIFRHGLRGIVKAYSDGTPRSLR